MNAQTTEGELRIAFALEMTRRMEAGECVSLGMNLQCAFNLLGALQLVLCQPGFSPLTFAILNGIAESLEEKLGATPACKEVCRRGWMREYDRGIDPDLP